MSTTAQRVRRSRPTPNTTGLRLRLDADTISGVADGAAVATWADTSGNGNDAAQATSGNRPTYAATAGPAGKPAVAFNGAQWLDSAATNTAPLTVMLLLKSGDGGIRHFFYGGATANGLQLAASSTMVSSIAASGSSGPVWMYAGLGADYITSTAPWVVVAITVDGSGNYVFMMDGQVSRTGQAAALTSMTASAARIGMDVSAVAASAGLTGWIAHTSVWGRVLTTAELLQADADLRQRYGLPAPMTGVLDLKSPTATNNVTHPDVQYFASPWNGYSYWMAHTPFPVGGDENPHVLVSNDGDTWTAPPGLTNPVISQQAALDAGYGFNSDTEMLLVGSTMELYSRYGGGGTTHEGIVRITSTDGVTWTSPQIVLSTSTNATILSPSLHYTGSTRYMWTINNTTLKMERRSSSDGITWSSATVCTITGMGGDVPWHHNVVFSSGIYHCLMTTSRPYRTRYMTSTDGLAWTTDGKDAVPLSGTSWDAGGHYRSSFLPLGGGVWDVWLAMLNYNQTGGEGDWKVRRLQITLPRP